MLSHVFLNTECSFFLMGYNLSKVEIRQTDNLYFIDRKLKLRKVK